MQSHRPSIHEPVFEGGGENVRSSLCANNQQTHEFSCVQVVDENRPNAGVAHEDYYSVIQEQQKKLNKFIVESTLGGCSTGMRLNVPAVNMTTTTTIINSDTVSNCAADNNNTHHFYVSSAAPTAATTTVLSDVTSAINSDNRNNSGQGSLTIPVNQQTSSVNIVNCYRTVPVQLVNTIQNDGDENRVKESPSNNNNRKINENNKCDIIEVVDDSSEKEKSSKLSSSIINISTIENINQIVSDKDDKDNKSKGTLPFDTSKLEQSIYISSSDQTNVDAINSVHDPIIVQENVALSSPIPTSREQRRRERRERRAARNRMAHIHAMHSQVAASVNSNHIAAAAAQIHQLTSSHALLGSNQVRPVSANFEIIPDLLHSHLPPPYTTLPLQPGATIIATPVPVPVSAVDNCRYSFPLPIIRR